MKAKGKYENMKTYAKIFLGAICQPDKIGIIHDKNSISNNKKYNASKIFYITTKYVL